MLLNPKKKNKEIQIDALFFVLNAPEALLSSNTQIMNNNDAKPKDLMHSNVCILGTVLCRYLENNNLTVLPFNIFQQQTILSIL